MRAATTTKSWDLYLALRVEVPKQLSKEQRRLFEELRRLESKRS